MSVPAEALAVADPESRPASRLGLRLLKAAPVLALAALPLAPGHAFYLHLGILVALNVVFTLSLGIVSRVGQLSLAHGAFVGVGAYAAVLAVVQGGLPFSAGVLVAAAVAALLAAGLGWTIMRLRGVYFVLVTFAFGELVRLLLLDFPSISGGANGITGIPPARLLGVTFDTKPRFYALAVAAALGVYLFTRALLRSPVGRAFGAVSENLALAEGSGTPTRNVQILAFAIGSGIAGGGGALLAHYVGYISPETFNFQFAVNLIVMLVVGGRGSLLGPVLGAALLTPMPELLRATLELQHILYGAALILVLRFLPAGLGGIVDGWLARRPAAGGRR